jgi:hypothetical protein
VKFMRFTRAAYAAMAIVNVGFVVAGAADGHILLFNAGAALMLAGIVTFQTVVIRRQRPQLVTRRQWLAPGLLWVVLAGKEHRARLSAIRRQRHDPVRVRDLEVKCGIVPPSALEVRWNEFGRQMSAGMASFRAPLTGHSPGRPEHCWMCADRYRTQELGRVRRAENEGPR